jgi:hypothetical protein
MENQFKVSFGKIRQSRGRRTNNEKIKYATKNRYEYEFN